MLSNRYPIIIHEPLVSIPENQDTIIFETEVIDNTDNVKTVELIYSESLSVLPLRTSKMINMKLVSGNTYRATLSKSGDFSKSLTEFYYYIKATDNYGVSITHWFPFIGEHKVIFSNMPSFDGKLCSEFNVLKICANEKTDNLDGTFTFSDGVFLGGLDSQVNGNPEFQLNIGTEIIVNENTGNFQSKDINSSGAFRALQIKSNIHAKPIDFPIFIGTVLRGNLDSGIFIPVLGGEKIGSFLSFYGWQLKFNGQPNKNLLDLAKETFKFTMNKKGLITITGLQFNVDSFSPLKPIKVKTVKLDQEGNDTTALIKITGNELINDLGIKSKRIGSLNMGLDIGDTGFEVDFARRSINLLAAFSFGSSSEKQMQLPFAAKGIDYFDKIDAKLGFLVHPKIALDKFEIGATLKAPDRTNKPFILGLPGKVGVGFAPTKLKAGFENFSGNNTKYFISLSGAPVDKSGIHTEFNKLVKKWLISGTLTGSLVPATFDLTLKGNLKLLKNYELAHVTTKTNFRNKVSVEAAFTFPSKKLDIFRGQFKLGLSNNQSQLSFKGDALAQIRIPQDVRIVGGVKIASAQCKVSFITSKTGVEESYIKAIGSLGWAEYTIGYDFEKNQVLRRNRINDTISIGGYDRVNLYQVVNLSRSLKTTEIINILPDNDVVFIAIYSSASTPDFEVITPTGDVYTPEDGMFGSNLPLTNIAFFKTNPTIHESIWALKSPIPGNYQIKIRNAADIGNYNIEVLNQNKSPQIQLTSPTSNIQVKSGDKITITWNADDIDDNARISLYYDKDTTPNDDGLIVHGISEDGSTNSYEWTVPDNMYGTYYIYAEIDDNNHLPVVSYSQGKIVFPDLPAPSVPSNLALEALNGAVKVSWDDNPTSENVLFYRIYIRENGKEALNSIVIDNSNNIFTYENLGNNIKYDIAVSAINDQAFESQLSLFKEVIPQGNSTDGPPDLSFHQDIEIEYDNTTILTKISIINSNNYLAYSYTVDCWIGAEEDKYLVGSKNSTNLSGNSTEIINFNFDQSIMDKTLDPVLICKITDVSLNELNDDNNFVVYANVLNITDPVLDTDNDGISDVIEENAPNNGDGNNDGISDAIQNNVASTPSALNNYITIEASSTCVIMNVNTPQVTDPSFNLVYGAIGFSLENCAIKTVDTKLYFYGSEIHNNLVYRKLDNNNQWFTFQNNVFNTTTINGKNVLVSTLTLTDNGIGDNNPTIGSITDPGGPGVNLAPPIIPVITPIPTLSEWGMILLISMIIIFAWYRLYYLKATTLPISRK